MDNCGGGQRLPPDGDEFPAAYQEFGNSNNNQQYRFVATATRTTTMTTSAGLVCNESESFVGADGFKMLASDSNVVGSRSIVLSADTRVTVASVENPGDESKTSFLPDDVVKKTGSSYSRFAPQNSNVQLSEKKIEIAGYYHKDVGLSETSDVHEKEAPVDVPPPLPLTGPPKIEPVTLNNRNLDAPPQRKFSLNGELWRQDDKSERSVRDKIAMFSSQSSLDSPLFPNSLTVAAVTSNGRRLSKYKSSEDVCADDKSPVQKERSSFLDRTQSSFDLTDSSRSFASESPRKYGRSTSLSQSSSSSLNSTLPTNHVTKIESQKNSVISTTPLISSFEKQNFGKTLKNYGNCYSANSTNSTNPQNSLSNVGKSYNSNCTNNSANCPKPATTTALTRATSFSGSSAFTQDRSTPSSIELNSTQISRTNSLASTFRRPSEDMRRTSLNQLIEQRRRSISKLRGLVIPEKETLPIDQPIVDLPEIKSRDSILLQQIPKANIQDKWGSQSSLASTTSTASVPAKATTSFKMPAPQIHSKYSPAFKRKSLTVYGSSGSSINGNMNNEKNTLGTANTNLTSEPPKSLESICSPTRSDYSFEFASSSPDGSRSRPKTVQRKTRTDYDDSDNDSAVSSSQSSISRGFSPPMSPVPSERSTVSSSERSYVSTETNYQRRSLIMESPGRTFIRAETVGAEREQFSRGILGEKTNYLATERSSNGGGSNSRSPSEIANTQNPPRQLRRSNSTDTNCSSSSTLTSGSQASAESLSRRVLKPQSVEAINRKNILASARCRSGRDLNGSPLIQRKFSDDEESAVSSTTSTTTSTSTMENGGQRTGSNNVTSMQDVKIAYIEVTDSFIEDNSGFKKNDNEPKLPPKRSIPAPAVRPPKSEMLEPSNDLKMWVRTEAKALARSEENNKSVNNKIEKNTQLSEEVETHQSSLKIHSNNSRNGRSSMFEEQSNIPTSIQKKISSESENESSSIDSSKQRKSNFKRAEDQNDLLTILTTRSRSRSAIHVDDGSFGRSKSQMSLEDILSGKGTDSKLLRTQSVEAKPEKNGAHSNSPGKTSWIESRVENRYRKSSGSLNESWSNEEKPFVSKIPTLGRSKIVDSGEETSDGDRPRTSSSSIPSKIPSGRSLGRRSASVTDMKKALEKIDNLPNQHQTTTSSHSRFPSLDSSIDENSSTVGTTEGEVERCYGEQFGSISSLASSTSLISQQELAQLVEEASLEEAGRGAHEVIVVLLHKENPTGSVGITLAGGADCEVKEITVHRVLTHSIADKDGRVQRGDRILSINGRSTRGLTHRESLAVLKQPRSEVVLVVSRTRLEEGCKLRSRTASVETIVEGFETNSSAEDTAWGPPSTVAVYKDGAGLGFSLEGGRDSPLGDRPLVIKKIFTGGAAEKTGILKAGDQLLEVNGSDVTRMSRIEAWSLMKKLHDGEVNLLVRHPATKSSS